ncbi:type II CAAX prenyl endopeptidase Rce1 family protein [Kitasatospora sp. NPDC088346]|uniref:CPBP family glutamic-type intramembrane protease n=1 Tax=Kitasatospora sp. NPDC088346 TaxID=3364073 RepID=UPI00380DF2EB
MWSHTRSLELLVLVATVAPAELIRVATAFGPAARAGASTGAGVGPGAGAGADRGRAARWGTLGAPAAYLAVTALAVAVAADGGFVPDTLTGWRAGAPWLAAAVVVGVALVGAEFAVGAVPRLLDGTGLPRLAVHRGAGPAGGGYAAAVLVTAAVEEVLYRGLWIGVLHERLRLPVAVAVGAAAVAYAVGHLFFGGLAVVQKAVSGTVFGLLAVVSGSLAVPLAAHLAQNGAVVALALRQERGGRATGRRAAAG